MSVKLVLVLAIAHAVVSMPVDEELRPARRCLIVYNPNTGMFEALVPSLNLGGLFVPNPPVQNPNMGGNVNVVPPAGRRDDLMLVLP